MATDSNSPTIKVFGTSKHDNKELVVWGPGLLSAFSRLDGAKESPEAVILKWAAEMFGSYKDFRVEGLPKPPEPPPVLVTVYATRMDTGKEQIVSGPDVAVSTWGESWGKTPREKITKWFEFMFMGWSKLRIVGLPDEPESAPATKAGSDDDAEKCADEPPGADPAPEALGRNVLVLTASDFYDMEDVVGMAKIISDALSDPSRVPVVPLPNGVSLDETWLSGAALKPAGDAVPVAVAQSVQAFAKEVLTKYEDDVTTMEKLLEFLESAANG
jgi:hypothetical protein